MEQFKERQPEPRNEQKTLTKPTASTVFLEIDSKRTKGILGSKYSVPNGFLGVMVAKDGSERILYPGEEATGDFKLKLVRDRDVRLPLERLAAKSRDGFDAELQVDLSVAADVEHHDALDRFIERVVGDRQHVDWPVLRDLLRPHVEAALRDTLRQHDIRELLTVEDLQDQVLAECRGELEALGLSRVLVELGDVTSDELSEHQSEINELQRDGEKRRAEQKIQDALLRDQMGQELTRAELEEVLDSAREQGLIRKVESKKAVMEHQAELDQLEAEYRKQRHSLESALREMQTRHELDLDALKLDQHMQTVKKLREELSDDRIEVYIQSIKDESLKAVLLQQLIHRTMSPEQLKAVAEIEAQRTRQEELRVSRPRLEPVREQPDDDEHDDTVSINKHEDAQRRTAELEELTDHSNDELTGGEALRLDFEDFARQVESDVEGQNDTQETPEVDKAPEPVESESDDEATEVSEPKTVEAPEPLAEVDALALVACGRRAYAIDPFRQENLDNVALMCDYKNARLGSLRSVRIVGEGDQRMLLAGARNGVYATLLKHNRDAREFPIGRGINATTGINASVLYQGFIYATHSEFGLLRWPALQPFSPSRQVMPDMISQYSTTRALQIFDDRLLFANGPSVLLLEGMSDQRGELRIAAKYEGTRHEVTSIVTDEQYVVIADSSGSVFIWDPRSDRPERAERAFTAPSTISGLASGSMADGRRALCVATKQNFFPMLFRDGSTALEFISPEPIRSISMLGNTVIGLSYSRRGIYAWRINRPDWPMWQFRFPEVVLDIQLEPPARLLSSGQSSGPHVPSGHVG